MKNEEIIDYLMSTRLYENKEFHGEPWNIRQILTNIDMIIPVEDRN